MHILDERIWFPDVTQVNAHGLVAAGGDLSVERLQLAYRSGIFPWYSEGEPILWWSPDPRLILIPENFRVSKSLRKVLRSNTFNITFNQQFEEVIRKCASIKRPGQEDTWITEEMIVAYERLYNLGMAVSVEVWLEKELVGGLYGIDLADKGVFCGESMFATANNASKVAMHALVQRLKERNYHLIDCQVPTDHLISLGAEIMSRSRFLNYLK